jgi:hypothetical protein
VLSQVAYSREGFSATNSHSQAGANAMSDAELVDMFDHVDVANGAVQCSAVQCSAVSACSAMAAFFPACHYHQHAHN